MGVPTTPQKQATSFEVVQQVTPPATVVKNDTTIGSLVDQQDQHLVSTIRRLTFDPPRTPQKVEQELADLAPTLWEDDVKQPEERCGQEVQNQNLVVIRQRGSMKQKDEPQSEVKRWIYSSKSPEQRRQRFYSMLHGLWPSNDEFNAARHPFYDPEEDGLYDDFIKYQIWDGHCPYDDDDYNPYKDPARSIEVWQPKIGEEGIEDEEDLRMVLKARHEQRARSDALRIRKTQVVEAQMRAGVDRAHVDMTQVLFGPEIESDDSDSEEEDTGNMPPKIKTETGSTSSHAFPGNYALQAITTTKGTNAFCGEGASRGRGRPRGSKNKKMRGRLSNKKRKRDPDGHSDGTYKYEGGSEEEEPTRKRGRKGKAATGDSNADNLQWKAQTRAAARRVGYGGMDGIYDENDDDTNSPIDTSSGTDQSSDLSDGMTGSTRSNISGSDEDNGPEQKIRFLSRVASFFI